MMQMGRTHLAISFLLLVIGVFNTVTVGCRLPEESSTILIIEDTYIEEVNAYKNFGASDDLLVGNWEEAGLSRALLFFDLSEIPPKSTVESATLLLTVKDVYGFPDLYLHRIIGGKFDENCANWVRRTCTQGWDNEGGDYEKEYIDLKYGGLWDRCTKVNFDITGFVQKVVNGEVENYGVILLIKEQTARVWFYSSESSPTCPDAKPRVEITYTPPSMSVMVSKPGQGETLRPGRLYTVKWSTKAGGHTVGSGMVKIYYSTDGGLTWNYIDCVENTGSYNWHVPSITSENCRIKVEWLPKCDSAEVWAEASSETFRIVPQTPDFSIEVNPASATVQPGGESTFTLRVQRQAGFTADISVELTGLPEDASYTVSKVAEDTYQLIIIAGQVEGSYPVTVRATGGGKTHIATITLVVSQAPPTTSPPVTPTETPQPAFSFDITVQPAQASIHAGEESDFTITVALTGGTPETVTLTLSGLPPDYVWAFNPQTLTPTSTATLHIKAGETTGTFTLIVTGTGGGVSKSAYAILKVEEKARCIIATAAYGSEQAVEVQTLRRYRDEIAMDTVLGAGFIETFNKAYYSFSPSLAGWISKHDTARAATRALIRPLLFILRIACQVASPLQAVSNEAMVLASGVVASILVGIVYLSLPAYLIHRLHRLKIDRYFKEAAAISAVIITFQAVPAAAGSIVIAQVTTPILVLYFIVLGASIGVEFVKLARRCLGGFYRTTFSRSTAAR